MKSLNQITIFLASAFLFLAGSHSLAIASLDVVINEIAWMGTEEEGIEPKNWWRYEWLELHNNTKQIISLEGWKIELYRQDLDWVLELTGNIFPNDYFLIVASDKIFSDYDLNYSNLGGKLINSGQKVLLKDNLGNIIDEIDCYSYGKWFAGDNETKQTMERKNSQLSGNNPDNWGTSQDPGGTPKTKNSLASQAEFPPVPQSEPQGETKTEVTDQTGSEIENQTQPPKEPVYPGNIFINEILPSPEGPDAENEWIEIFNENNFEVDLSDWKIRDTIGKTNTYIIPQGTGLNSFGFLILRRLETKITLQNSGDGLELLNPEGRIVHKVEYSKAPKSHSFNRIPTGWSWSLTLTPGKENIITIQKVIKNKKSSSPPGAGEDTDTDKKIPLKDIASAKIGKSLSESSNSLMIFLVALVVAVGSAIIVLVIALKTKKKNNYL